MGVLKWNFKHCVLPSLCALPHPHADVNPVVMDIVVPRPTWWWQ